MKSLFFVTMVVATSSAGATDFPELDERIDDIARPVGTNNCATERTGAWRVKGGIVIELQKPKKNCNFRSLTLVVDGKEFPLTAVDDTFFQSKKWIGGIQAYVYEWWRSDSGKLYFKISELIDPSKIQGLLEVGCNSTNCLDEASAVPFRTK